MQEEDREKSTLATVELFLVIPISRCRQHSVCAVHAWQNLPNSTKVQAVFLQNSLPSSCWCPCCNKWGGQALWLAMKHLGGLLPWKVAGSWEKTQLRSPGEGPSIAGGHLAQGLLLGCSLAVTPSTCVWHDADQMNSSEWSWAGPQVE